MFKVLLKTRLAALFDSVFRRGSVNSKERGPVFKVLMGLLALYVIVALLFSTGAMFHMIAKPLISVNLGWLYFSLTSLFAFILSFVGSVFVAKAQIFEAKDNDLLLSMPISPSVILASRASVIVFLNLIYTLFIMLPAIFVYGMNAEITPAMLTIFIIAVLLLPFFSSAVSLIFGWLIALISSKLRRKNLITTILMLVFFIGYMSIYMNMQSYMSELISNGEAIGEAIKKVFPPAYFFGTAINNIDWLSLLLFALWCIVPFLIIYIVLARSFIKIATTNVGEYKAVYVEKSLKSSSSRIALIKKDLLRFFNTPIYLINCGLGVIFQIIIAGALIIKGSSILPAELAAMGDTVSLPIILCLIMCFCVAMTNTTAPSISLEGKNLWLLKALPVATKDVLFAKIDANLIIGIPVIIVVSIVSWIALPMSFLEGLIILMVPLTLQVFTALWGLISNLIFPKLDWINETTVIKQSASVLVGMFGILAIIMVAVILYVAKLSEIIPIEQYMMICALFFIILSIGMVYFIRTKGVRMFETL